MDFSIDESVADARDLARGLLTQRVTEERLRAAEASATGLDEQLWSELAAAGLLGISIPESYGGAGMGLDALCAVLQEQGRCVAPVPLWPAYVAALTLAEQGTDGQCRVFLPGIADGSVRVTMALEEFGAGDCAEPTCRAERSGDRWLLTGDKAVVPGVVGSRAVLVSAVTDEGPGLFVVPTVAPGVEWEVVVTTTQDRAGNLTLRGAAGEVVGTPGDGGLTSVLETARVCIAALQLGVAESAIALAAEYLSARHQFGRPLATFQAVQHQLADCYIHTDALRTCLWKAVDSLQKGKPSTVDVDIAKWWADEAGLATVFSVVHVHGGIGVDVSYPVHRQFLWGKELSGMLGGRSTDLARLGAQLASGAPGRTAAS